MSFTPKDIIRWKACCERAKEAKVSVTIGDYVTWWFNGSRMLGQFSDPNEAMAFMDGFLCAKEIGFTYKNKEE